VALEPSSPGAPPTHLDQEWLLTNGTGAYALGTVPGVNTRSYHALLVAATRPPVGRIVLLNQVLEQLVLTGSPANAPSGASGKQANSSSLANPGAPGVELTALMFRDPAGREVMAPQGHTMLRRFEKGLRIAWHYQVGAIRISRELFLHWKEQAATLRYQVHLPPEPGATPGATGVFAVLRLSPMVSLRDFHALLRKDVGPAFRVEARRGQVTIRREAVAATLACAAPWTPRKSDPWWFNIYYRANAQRGQEFAEDYFVPGTFEVPLSPGDNVALLTIALGDKAAHPLAYTGNQRAEHLAPIAEHLAATGFVVQASSLQAVSDAARIAALQGARPGAGSHGALDPKLAHTFAIATVGRKPLATLLAGFPWFADWGRDTFIALPGILLETGRFDEARRTLLAFAQSIREGLVPNRFDDYDSEAAHYNTVDASLWYIHAAIAYVRASNDQDTWHDWLGESCRKIIDAYIRGTQYGIRMAGDGLITAGGPDTQLTWMDAACNGVVFTPRYGKAIEINALWYYALVTLGDMLGASHAPLTAHFNKLADRIRRSFSKVFWDEQRGYLIDHVWTDAQNQDHPDVTLRPNQVLALSLPVSPLPRTKQVQALDVLRRRLLTPAGLRTLPADDPRYHAIYGGTAFQRDESYHQGMVWPWLIGPYCEAVLRLGDFSPEARAEARAVLTPLLEEFQGRGLGQLHEIHEPNPPFRPVGCIAQAWSVGEVLRALRLIESAPEPGTATAPRN
jgi:glycogen debranching enzyme